MACFPKGSSRQERGPLLRHGGERRNNGRASRSKIESKPSDWTTVVVGMGGSAEVHLG